MDRIYQVVEVDNVYYVIDVTKISVKKFKSYNLKTQILVSDFYSMIKKVADTHAETMNELYQNQFQY